MTTPRLHVIQGDDAPGPAELAEFVRPLPHNIEAEQHTLGAAMLAPAVLAEIGELLDGTEFYRPAHGLIWSAIQSLDDRGALAEPVAVAAALDPRDLAAMGGAPYLHTLISRVPTAANGPYYAHLVRDLAYARQVVTSGTRLMQLGYAATGDTHDDLRGAVVAELATVTNPQGRGWAEPTPLSATAELPPFPVWAFPDWLGEYAAGLAEVTQTPPDLAGSLALAVLAVAAGGKVWARATTWTEPTNLFTLVVLPPGNRKSEVYKHMTAPIKAAEAALVEQTKPLIAEAVIARKVAEANAEKTEKAATAAHDPTQRAVAMDEAAAARLDLDQTPIPAEPCLFSDDATVERLTSHVAEQGGRFAILSPEGEIFSIAAGRYSGAPNLAILKSGHAGEEMRIDRMGRPSERITAATITLGICTQPGVLARLGETPQFGEQGLLGRLLYSVPVSLLGFRNERPDPMPEHVRDTYSANVQALVLSLAALAEPATLHFAPDAQAAILDLAREHEIRLRPGTGDLAHMTDWAGKYIGAVVRIAALLHLAQHHRDGWDQPITLATFTNARLIGEYYTHHAQAAYDAIGADPATNDARALLDWIQRTATTRFTAREVIHALKRFRKVADLEPALHVLESHGWIRRLPTPPKAGPGRKAGTTYEAHPNAIGDVS
ncbi:DUF3987 domain-containing protein [Actinomadura barringtoniae]|uniref:DUF3987 domain-containing protein n=1 Tax=Actinomadura barringtoniae TaxID=1427535 RepID=A0A939TBL2_9ACTN|nr:DUF3987 domain-containing protein [Actinomadura barringtoniae]MBO2453652.1 DUF3987 domain-containing protein [Actinomadura barringtoniae]